VNVMRLWDVRPSDRGYFSGRGHRYRGALCTFASDEVEHE
jgi:hypothetical protein